MARYKSGSSSSGRRGSSRSDSGKSSDRRSGGKSFKRSGSKGSGPGKPSFSSKPSFRRSSSADKDERGSFGKRRSGPSQDSRGERPFKKFDKPYGKKMEGSDSRESSFGKRRSGPSPDSRGERPFRKFDKPYGKKREGSDSRESSFGKRRSGPSQDSRGERPFKKFDKPYGKKREGSDSREGSYGNKRGGSSDAGKKPFRKEGERSQRSFGEKREGFSKGPKRPYKKFDADRRDKPPHKKDGDWSEKKTEGTPGDERGFFKKSKRPRRVKDVSPETPAPTQTEKIRLNKYIANSGVCSRREADELITMGLISVNGKTISELGYKVNPGDEVRYESRVLTAEKPVYILMNKPKGYLTTTDDPQERNTVMHLIGNAVKERIYPVGRLDRNTTGLLLLTNDGDLADKLMHPSYNTKKIYKIDLDRPLTKGDFQTILDGVVLEEGRAMVDDLAIVSEDGKTVGMELHIGWNRVVRRIFENLQYEVIRLDRSVYAGLDKKNLGRGEWRFLTKEELIRLKHYK